VKKIKVQFVDSEYTDYVWVRPIPKPASGGHKALKNEDFIDHDDLILRNSYYKQVVEKRLSERYFARVANPTPPSTAELENNKVLGMGRNHAIPEIPDKPLYRIPTIK
jgi:hypothetical protein